jgi:hypothetical protein
MTFPILGANSAVGGYAIDNSLRFNDDDSARLTRTPSANGNQQTFTTSFWVKKGNISDCTIFSFGTGTTYNIGVVEFGSEFFLATTQVGVTQVWSGKSEGKYRDVSAWYHVVIAIDTTQATSSNRVKAYINGNFVSNQGGFTYPSQNYNAIQNPQTTWAVGSRYDGNNPADMYLAEIHHIDGQQLDASSFGEFDEDSGIWKPIEYTGTYGTNGFYLDFENSGSLGADQSGNGNNFTPTNLASTDQTTDTPTNNFATMNALWRNASAHSNTYSEGNLKINLNSGGGNSYSTMAVSSGKWYFEFETLSNFQCQFEGRTIDNFGNYSAGAGNTTFTWYYSGDIKVNNTSTGISQAYGHQANNTSETKEICGVAVDLDNNKVYFHRLGTYVNSANPSTGTNGISITNAEYIFGFSNDSGTTRNVATFNYGNPPYTISSGNSDQNGYGNFEYAPPSGYLALCTQNLATELSPTIDDGSQYFNTVLYSGDGTTNRTISGVGFQPDWTWLKRRSSAYSHALLDSNRGGGKVLGSDNTDAENTNNNVLSSWNSDGFVIALSGVSAFSNTSGQTYVGWNWKANAGSTSSNTDGSITSTVQANTTAGFSIVTYTGTGSNATIGHGIGKAPSFLVTKARNTAGYAWIAWHSSFAGNESIELQSTDAKTTSATAWNSTVPTSSVFSVGTRLGTNASGTTYVAYCFAEIEGYSKFGSYTGNGSTDGAFIYTGFKPAFVIIKRTNSTGQWTLIDTTRQDYNLNDRRFHPNLSDAEYSGDGYGWDMLSNGFKQRSTSAEFNGSGASFIYIAFAENPFVSSTGIPVTAR